MPARAKSQASPSRTNASEARLALECFTIADAAEVADGKLFVLGGAINRVLAQEFPHVQGRLALPLVIRTTQQFAKLSHRLVVRLLSEKGEDILDEPVEAELPAGVPAGATRGDPLRVVAVVAVGGLQIPAPGLYTFILEVDGKEFARTPFRAVLRPAASPQSLSVSPPEQ